MEEKEDRFQEERRRMVKTQIRGRGLTNDRILEAMGHVPRHSFVPPEYRLESYYDGPLPIGYGQTISQPYIVAYMTDLLRLHAGSRILEIGTGCGYQTAILAELSKEVYSIEIVEPLHHRAKMILAELGYTNVHLRHGDGSLGWEEAAPFDGIIVTAAPLRVPEPLLKQLAVDGILVCPVGSYFQEIQVVTRTAHGYTLRADIAVRFVPMTGDAQM